MNTHKYKYIELVSENPKYVVFFQYKYVEQKRLSILKTAFKKIEKLGISVENIKFYITDGIRQSGYLCNMYDGGGSLIKESIKIENSRIEISYQCLLNLFDI